MAEPLRRAAAGCGALAILAAIGLVATGCGQDSPPPDARATIGRAEAPNLDPATAAAPGDLEILWLVHTPLLTYRHAEGEDGEELIPGLASDLPEVSDDGRTYRLHLRDGLEYSDATPVRASDFERAVRRVLTLQPPDAPLYEEIAGAREFVAAGDPEGDVTGITADDESGEIRIELTRRDASFANLLALVSSAPLPASTDPASASSRIPGVGPYEIDPEPDSSSSDGNTARAQPRLPGSRHPRHPHRQPRLDRDQGRWRRRRSRAGSARRQARLHAGFAAAPTRGDAARAGRRSLPRAPVELDPLLQPRQAPGALRRPAGPRGSQHGDRPNRTGARRRGSEHPRLLVPAAGGTGLRRGPRPRRLPLRRPRSPAAASGARGT